MHKINKKKLVAIIGWIISIALLISLFANMNINVLVSHMVKANWIWLAMAAITSLIVVCIKSYRWQLIMDPEKKYGKRRNSFWLICKVTFMGFAGNNLLPARGGDWLKIYLLGKWKNMSKASLASVTALDKIFDGISILLLFGLFALYAVLLGQHHTYPTWVKTGSIIVSIVIIVSLGICAGLLIYHKRTRKKTELGQIATLIQKLGAGMNMLSRKKIVLATILISLVSSLLQILTIWMCQMAFNIDMAPWIPAVIFIAINLAIIIPSAPSGIGPFEAAGVLAYTWIGLKTETAFNISFMYHAVQFIPVTLIGMSFYFKSGLAKKRYNGKLVVGRQ